MSQYRLKNHRPLLAKDVGYVAPSAELVGQVHLAKGASVWFNAVLRADHGPIWVGVDSNIQDNVSVHVSPNLSVHIGERVSIGHNAVIHGCTIGDDCIIGMGAVILNNARIGKRCIVAAGALVPGGCEFPDGSLIMGAPAKLARALSDIELEKIRTNAEEYLELSADYRKPSAIARLLSVVKRPKKKAAVA